MRNANVTVHDRELGGLVFPAGDKVIAPYIAEHETWSPSEVVWLKKNVYRGSNCLNVGANVGYFSIWMSRLCQEGGHVLAVEPNPTLLPLLAENINSRGLLNVTVLPVAAGAENGETTLFQNESNYGDSRVFDPRKSSSGGDYLYFGFDESPKSTSVPMVRMDDILEGQRIDVALIDVQGWEHFVLRGMQETLATWKPRIVAEFTPTWIADLGEDPEHVIAEYMSYGYTVSIMDYAKSRPLLVHEFLPAVKEMGALEVNLVLRPKHVPWSVRRERQKARSAAKRRV